MWRWGPTAKQWDMAHHQVHKGARWYGAYRKDLIMLKWALIFALIAVVAGLLGFTGVAAGAASIAKILFGIFLVLALVVLLLAVLGVKAFSR